MTPPGGAARSRRELAAIVAVGPGGLIGRAGALPWRCPEDLTHFRTVTTGRTLIVGRATFSSLPGVLPHRRFVVVTRHPELIPTHERVRAVTSPAAALELAYRSGPEPVVAGGARLYRELLDQVTRLHWTDIPAALVTGHPGHGDRFMCPIPWDRFTCTHEQPGSTLGVRFTTWERTH